MVDIRMHKMIAAIMSAADAGSFRQQIVHLLTRISCMRSSENHCDTFFKDPNECSLCELNSGCMIFYCMVLVEHRCLQLIESRRFKDRSVDNSILLFSFVVTVLESSLNEEK